MAFVARLNVNRSIDQGDMNPVGMVASSMLTESQFQTLNGTSWILADGRSIAGSLYATVTGNSTAPDLRGITLRGKNNGRVDGNQDPDGERALGAFQSHATAKNGLTASSSDSGHGHSLRGGGTAIVGIGSNGANVMGATAYNGNYTGIVNTDGVANITTTLSTGDNETRMRNVAVNQFIKIN